MFVCSLRKISTTVVLSMLASAASAHDDTADITDVSLEQLLNVEVFTASRFSQKENEAPSSVTVISDEAIRVYGYRTLKDILNSIPGLYSTDDRNYSYLGVRGFGLAGDFNSRVLLLLDGHRVNENINDSFGTDYDGLVNIDLIKRVEFSSGPGSAIYGANAFFGVINIITKSADEIDGLQASVDYASEHSRKARVTVGKALDSGIEAMFSVSAYKSDGADIYFPEFDDPATNNGIAKDLDYEKAKNLFAKLKYENWGFQVAYNERIKGIPTASYEQEFNLAPSETTDTLVRTLLTYDTFICNESQIYTGLSLGRYIYKGDYIYDYPPVTVNRDENAGQWWNLDVRYQTTYFDKHRIIFGIEYQDNGTQDQANFDVDPFESYLDDRHSSELFGLYVQDEMRITDKLILNAGIRYDHNHFEDDANNNESSIVNPRIALIYALQQETTLKLIYGTAYRNANAYELYYGTVLGYLPSTDLKPEEIKTYEVNVEHYLSNNFKLNVSTYFNKTKNLIGLNSDVNGDIFYDNLDKVRAKGIDLEAEYVGNEGLKLRTSYSYVDTEIVSTKEALSNSPNNMAKFNLSLPVLQKKADAGIELQYLSSRLTPQGDTVGGYGITNLTLSSKKLYEQLELSASIYNVFDKHYADPASEEHEQSNIVQDGRNFRVKATYTF